MGMIYLIVDDSAVTRSMIRRAIQLSGLEFENVLQAGNGREALSVMETQRVDMVLADLHMPEMSGPELIAAMQQHPALKKTPLLIVTAEPSADRIVELCRIGAKGYLRKPFTPEQIRAAVAPIVEKYYAGN